MFNSIFIPFFLFLYLYLLWEAKMDVKLQVQKVRITLKALEGLTYVCTDALLLEDVTENLSCNVRHVKCTASI